MGSANFCESITIKKTVTDDSAFMEARQRAQYEHGSGGYSGSLGEKDGFIMIHRAKSQKIAETMAGEIMSPRGIPVFREEITVLVDDKWGPAGAIRYPIDATHDGIIFFGWASS